MFSSRAVNSPELFCPAKLNLLLAVTGRRTDGFHDLVSVVAPVEFGDRLRIEAAAEFSLHCDDPAVPAGGTNLVLKAAQAFRAATGWTGGARFTLTKRIPMGAGLGGGSSNAAMALLGLNRLAGGPLAAEKLAGVAAQVGSDCALFLAGGPVVIRGRGEQVAALPAAVATRLRGRRVLIFKPAFASATPWAYTQLAAQAPGGYLPAGEAEARVGAFVRAVAAGAAWEDSLFNALEGPGFRKFIALPVLLGQLRARFGLAPRMSGSGSACFALLPDGAPVPEIVAAVRAAWGATALVVETRLA